MCQEKHLVGLAFCPCESIVCQECLPGVVRHFCEDPAERVAFNGELRCLACKAEGYDLVLLKRRLSNDDFFAFMDARQDGIYPLEF